MKNTLILCTCLTVLVATPAWAKKPDHAGRGNAKDIEWHDDRGHDSRGRSHDDKVPVRIEIGGDDRAVIRDYLRVNYGRNCPPGLAKKNNGCLPPGQAKKYAIGSVLNVPYDPVPRDLLGLLRPAPAGAFYAMVDKDVLLVSEVGKKILDAVTLLSAVN